MQTHYYPTYYNTKNSTVCVVSCWYLPWIHKKIYMQRTVAKKKQTENIYIWRGTHPQNAKRMHQQTMVLIFKCNELYGGKGCIPYISRCFLFIVLNARVVLYGNYVCVLYNDIDYVTWIYSEFNPKAMQNNSKTMYTFYSLKNTVLLT